MTTKIESIRYTIGTDGIRTMELGSLSLEDVIASYRSRLEASLTAAYPGAEIEITEGYDSRIEIDGERPYPDAYVAESAIRSLADAALEAVFDEAQA